MPFFYLTLVFIGFIGAYSLVFNISQRLGWKEGCSLYSFLAHPRNKQSLTLIKFDLKLTSKHFEGWFFTILRIRKSIANQKTHGIYYKEKISRTIAAIKLRPKYIEDNLLG